MKYLKLYKLFESLSNVIKKLTSEIMEEIDDINLEIKEKNPDNDLYLRLLDTNAIRVWNKTALIEKISIHSDYLEQIIAFDGDKRGYDFSIKRIKRMCLFLSKKHNVDIDVTYIYDAYIIAERKLITIIDWIYHFEYREMDRFWIKSDKIFEIEYYSTKMNMLYDSRFIFKHNIIGSIETNFHGFLVYVTHYDRNKMLILKFDRGGKSNLSEIKYDIGVFFDRITANHDLRLKEIIESDKKSSFLKISNDQLSFNVNDKSESFKVLYEYIADKTIEIFKVKKRELLKEISDILYDNNDFFTVEEEITSHIETIEDPKNGAVQFVIAGESFDDDRVFTIYVDDKLDMYINSIKDENKTSLGDLIHDIYLKLTDR